MMVAFSKKWKTLITTSPYLQMTNGQPLILVHNPHFLCGLAGGCEVWPAPQDPAAACSTQKDCRESWESTLGQQRLSVLIGAISVESWKPCAPHTLQKSKSRSICGSQNNLTQVCRMAIKVPKLAIFCQHSYCLWWQNSKVFMRLEEK